MASEICDDGGAVVCPAERHIPVDFADIYGIVKGNFSIAQKQCFDEICKLIESLYAQEFMSLRRNLKRNFKPFSVGAKGQKLQTRLGKSLPTKDDLDNNQNRLIEDFLQLMARARFEILSKREWLLGKEENFLFRLPVEVNWNYFDRGLLESFWSSSTELKRMRLLLPDMADCCLVFHRGLSVMEDSGHYFNDKIDLLLTYTVVWLFMKVWSWITSQIVRFKNLFRKKPNLTSAEEAEAHESVSSVDHNYLRHQNARVVERKSLRRLMPTLWSLLINFPRKISIQEPAYKEVVILYRSLSKPKKKGPVKAVKRAKEDRLADILSRRNIHIKCFHEIPMADIDAIFPEKKVFMKTLSIITMVFSAVTALGAALSMLLQTDVDLGVVGSAVALVIARCYQVYSSMQAERSDMVQEMTNVLYEKTDDAQEGVLSMLLEDMADEQLKEAVIAYIILFMGGQDGWLTQSELDNRCEKFLEEHFGLKLDFAVEDSLKRLHDWGLVQCQTRVSEVVWISTPLDEAHNLLTNRWSRVYEDLGKPDKKHKLPLVSLFSDHTQLPVLKGIHNRMRTAVNVMSGVDAMMDGVDLQQSGAGLSRDTDKQSASNILSAASQAQKTGESPVFAATHTPGSTGNEDGAEKVLDGSIIKPKSKDSFFSKLFKRKPKVH